MIQEKILVVEDDIQIQNFMVYKSGQEIHLMPMEYNLLYLYYKKSG